jgi:hypothetical protein
MMPRSAANFQNPRALNRKSTQPEKPRDLGIDRRIDIRMTHRWISLCPKQLCKGALHPGVSNTPQEFATPFIKSPIHPIQEVKPRICMSNHGMHGVHGMDKAFMNPNYTHGVKLVSKPSVLSFSVYSVHSVVKHTRYARQL